MSTQSSRVSRALAILLLGLGAGIFLTLFATLISTRPQQTTASQTQTAQAIPPSIEPAVTPLALSPAQIALLQTATARPVMIEVNRALLQATIIDATSVVVRSGLGGKPATATALHVQFAGNIATLEAIRPTAETLKIVLVQQAVQPTDAPEATLFAQASDVSRAASRLLVGTPTPLTTVTPSE